MRLVVRLVRKMGYGIDDQVTGKTGDGGIDGVIWGDKFRFDAPYTFKPRDGINRCQSMQSAALGEHWPSKNPRRGVMITTSSFPKSAYDYVKQIELQNKTN